MKHLKSYFLLNGFGSLWIKLFSGLRVLRYATVKKVVNFCRATLEMYLKREVVGSFPFRCYIEPTNLCNLRCPFCANITRPQRESKGCMSFSLFKKIIDEISLYTFIVHLYNQGESLLHQELAKLIRYAHSKKIATHLSTNLSIKLTEQTATDILSSGLDFLIVCLEALDQETYEKYRKGGKIDVVKANIRLLNQVRRKIKSKTFLSLRVFVTRKNENKLSEIRAFGKENGFDNVIFVPMIIDFSDSTAVNEWLPLNKNFWIVSEDELNSDIENKVFCKELWNYPVFNFDGKVLPCCLVYSDKSPYGDLARQPLKEVWNNTYYRMSRRVFGGKSISKTSDVYCVQCKGALKLFKKAKAEVSDNRMQTHDKTLVSP
ncbi:MAG: radical SAM protein [Deltaproteobacteria bacterium]|nr:radical SAM protein [Deltaproteobacteria bacterium]